MRPRTRLGYMVTMFPRLSETFILGEILELERRGLVPVIFTRKPADAQPLHSDYARVRGEIIPVGVSRPKDWPGLVLDHAALILKRPRVWLREARAMRGRSASSRRKFLIAGRVARHVLVRGLTHLHAHFAADNAKIARRAARMAGISFSFTAHAKDIWIKTPPESLRRLMDSARFAVTICRYNHDHLAGLSPEPQRLHMIYNGLDARRFSLPQGLRRNGNGTRELLAVGRLVPKKGFLLLPRVCRILEGQGLDFRCRLVGDGHLRASMLETIRSEGLQDRLLLEGACTQDRLVEEYLPRADILVAPCLIAPDGDRDGVPTVILEAMSMGIPVVATSVAGIPEAVLDRRTGILVKPDSPLALASAVAELICDPALAARLGRAGAERARNVFDIRRNTGRLLQLFEGDRL